MNDIDLRDLLPPERPMPDGRRREMRERLMIQIETESQHSRRRYRVFAGALAAGILAVAGAAGFLLSNKEEPTETVPSDTTMRPVPNDPERQLNPFPDQAFADQARFNISGALAAENSWWSELSAENVLCYDPESEPVVQEPVTNGSFWNTQVTGVAFDKRLVEEDFMAVCAAGNWRSEPSIATDAYDPENAVVCVRDRGAAGFPMAIVNLNITTAPTCEEIAADGVTVREMTEADMDQINYMRAVEVALLANPTTCPDQAATEEWVAGILADAAVEADVTPVAGDGIPEDSDCFQASMSWQGPGGDGEVQVEVARIEPPLEQP